MSLTRVYGYTGAGFNCKEGLGRDPLLTRQSDSFGIPRIEKNRKKKKRSFYKLETEGNFLNLLKGFYTR